jgi:hypothetical protein
MLNKYVVLPANLFLSHSWSKPNNCKRKRYVVPLGCGRLKEERRFLCDKGLPKLRADVYRCSLPCCRLYLCQLVLYVVICYVLAIPPALFLGPVEWLREECAQVPSPQLVCVSLDRPGIYRMAWAESRSQSNLVKQCRQSQRNERKEYASGAAKTGRYSDFLPSLLPAAYVLSLLSFPSWSLLAIFLYNMPCVIQKNISLPQPLSHTSSPLFSPLI